MKSIFLLLGLFMVLTLSSCDKEDNPVRAPEPESIEKLNNRTLDLFGQGTDVVDAALIIKKEFTYGDKILLKSLFDAGYSPADVTKAIHIAYDYNPRLAEPVLAGIMTNKTIGDVAEFIMKEYVAELKSHPDDLKYFVGTAGGLENKVTILKEYYQMEPASVFMLLRDVDENVTEVARYLTQYFPVTEGDVKDMMLTAGCSAEEIAGVLKAVYHRTSAEVLQFLDENDYGLIEVLSVLRNLYNHTIVEMAQLLDGLNYEADAAAAVLQELEYTNTEIAVVLKNHYNYTAGQTAALLKQLNAHAQEVMDILLSVYNLTVPEAVVILYDTGYWVDEIIAVLSDHLQMGMQEIIELLTLLGILPG